MYSLDKLALYLCQQYGGLDVLVNNAGIAHNVLADAVLEKVIASVLDNPADPSYDRLVSLMSQQVAYLIYI